MISLGIIPSVSLGHFGNEGKQKKRNRKNMKRKNEETSKGIHCTDQHINLITLHKAASFIRYNYHFFIITHSSSEDMQVQKVCVRNNCLPCK